jgi:CDP-6-deoxy-D-xylo-4-hexulose-3-dehydrase
MGLAGMNTPFVPGVTPILTGSGSQSLTEADKDEMKKVIDKGNLTEGEYGKKFEIALRTNAQKRFAMLTNSGSSANLVAMLAMMEIFKGKGKKVITCATGFPTTINAILQAGFEVILVDSSVLTLNANMDQVMSLLDRKDVAGVFLAHTLGFPYREDELKVQCSLKGKWLAVDACDALGSEIKDHYNINRPVGYFSDVHTYSFYPAHQIDAIEGGAALSDAPVIDLVMRSYRDWGRNCWCSPNQDNTCGKRFTQQFGELPSGYDHKYVYSRIGYNLKLTDVQAALGYSQMGRLQQFTDARRNNFYYMRDMLCNLNQYIFLPEYEKEVTPCPFGLPIVLKPMANQKYSKNELVKFLENRQIRTRPIFAGNIVRQPAYRDVNFEIPFRLDDADYLMNNSLWIGCHPSLTEEMLDYMVESLYQFFGIGG